MSRSAAVNAVYSVIGTVSDDACRLFTKIIRAKSLFDAQSIKKLILSGNISVSCDLLDAEQDIYTKEDLKDMEEVLMLLDNLPDVGGIAVVKGGMLSKEKERYICPEGHNNDKDEEFCATCGKNVKGLTSTQVKSIETYRQKIESLKFLFKQS